MTCRKTTGRPKASIIGLCPSGSENIASWLGIRAAETSKVLKGVQMSVTESEGIRFRCISPSVNRRTAHTVAGIFWSLNRDNETGLDPTSCERKDFQRPWFPTSAGRRSLIHWNSGEPCQLIPSGIWGSHQLNPSTCTSYRARSPGFNLMICPTRPLYPGLSISPKITQSALAKCVDAFNFLPKAVWSCWQHATALSMLSGKL